MVVGDIATLVCRGASDVRVSTPCEARYGAHAELRLVRRNAQNFAVNLVSERVDVAVWPLPHITKAFFAIGEQTLFGDHFSPSTVNRAHPW